MGPPNPTTATVDSGRIAFKTLAPRWLEGEPVECYCVPLIWRQQISLPDGHELEACILWSRAATPSAGWMKDPNVVLKSNTPAGLANQSLMFPARLDGKGRLCCAVLSIYADIAGSRGVWLVPEAMTVSIWTNFAFQYIHSRLELDD